MKKLLFAIFLFLCISPVFAKISIEAEVPVIGAVNVMEKNSYSINQEEDGVFDFWSVTSLENSSLAVDWNFPSENKFSWFAGVNIAMARYGFAFGAEGGFNYYLFQSQKYLGELQTKLKLDYVWNGLCYLIQPNVNLVLMDPSKKGWNLKFGVTAFNSTVFREDGFKMLNAVLFNSGIGYRF